jgi:nucleoside-triphosphatase
MGYDKYNSNRSAWCGKTTILMDVAQKLKARGVKVGGVVSREVRTGNVRIGFEFIDLATNDRDVLASVTGDGPRVGKYFVNLTGCRFAADRVKNALINSDVIICDEVGPMELKSNEFIDTVRYLLKTDKKAIVVIHQKLEHPLIREFREKPNSLININIGNREKVAKILLNELS